MGRKQFRARDTGPKVPNYDPLASFFLLSRAAFGLGQLVERFSVVLQEALFHPWLGGQAENRYTAPASALLSRLALHGFVRSPEQLIAREA